MTPDRKPLAAWCRDWIGPENDCDKLAAIADILDPPPGPGLEEGV